MSGSQNSSRTRTVVLRALVAVAGAACIATVISQVPSGAPRPVSQNVADVTAHRPAVTKVLVFMVENHSLGEMKGSMPRLYALAKRYAYATDYHAIRHPSLPNYLAIASGSTFGVTNDLDPAFHPLHGRTVFTQARAQHRTARLYADAMPTNCALANSGEYAVRHNPWTYFVDDRAACNRSDVPATRLAQDTRLGKLPNVGFVIPDVLHDAHDGTLAQADAWIGAQIKTLRSGPDWKSGRLAIVVTADEDDRLHGNKVLTVVASRYQEHKVVRTALTHYSLTGLLDDVIGAPHLRAAASAHSMRKAFGITVR